MKAYMVTAYGIRQGYWGPSSAKVKMHVAYMLTELGFAKSIRESFLAIRIHRLPEKDFQSSEKKVTVIPGTGGMAEIDVESLIQRCAQDRRS